MIDQIINWFHVNAQFITAVIAILTPILPTVIIKAINDKKLLETLKNIRNTEDLKKMANDVLREKVEMLQNQLDKLIKQQSVGDKLTKGLNDAQDLLIKIQKDSQKHIDDMLVVVNNTLSDLQKIIPDLKKEFYMIVGGKKDE